METLRACRRLSDIKRALETLPATLDDAYERILSEMSRHDKEEGLSILTWMAFSKRPLILKEVAEAAVIRPGPDPLDPDDRLLDTSEVLRTCRTLISVSVQRVRIWNSYSEEQDVVIFAHFSVQEYLLSGRSSLFSGWCPSPHEYISDYRLSGLLQLKGPTPMEQALEENLLLEYAAQYWFAHRGHLEGPTPIDDKILTLVDKSSPHILKWFEIYPVFDRLVEPYADRDENTSEKIPPSPLICACYLGFFDVVSRLIATGADIGDVSSRYGSPLHGAARSGRLEIAELLLQKGASVSAYNDGLGTPLEVAAIYGHEDMVRLLCCHGADVNSPSTTGGSTLQRCNFEASINDYGRKYCTSAAGLRARYTEN